MVQDVAQELGRLRALIERLVDGAQAVGHLAGEQAAQQLGHQRGRHGSQDLLHMRQRDRLAAIGGQLIEQADGIAKAARGPPRDERARRA